MDHSSDYVLSTLEPTELLAGEGVYEESVLHNKINCTQRVFLLGAVLYLF